MQKITRFGLILLASAVVMVVVAVGVSYRRSISPAPDCRDWKTEYASAQRMLSTTVEPSARAALLAQAAKAAIEVSDPANATRWGTEAVELLPRVRRDWNYGNIVHDAHMAHGRAALRQRNIELAKRELLLAGETPGSPQLNSFGPNMSLASDLLRAGERGVVIQYFHQCAKFWDLGRPRLRRWEGLAKMHLPPDFGANFLF